MKGRTGIGKEETKVPTIETGEEDYVYKRTKQAADHCIIIQLFVCFRGLAGRQGELETDSAQ